MKFSCDQCSAQYMIADEKVGPKGVKVKCKKCAHIIIVKPQTADAAAEPEPRDTEVGGDAGFGDMFDSPFDKPTQAMPRGQLESLAASSADGASGLPPAAPFDSGADSELPPAAADPFGAASDAGASLGFSAEAEGGFGATERSVAGGDSPPAESGFDDDAPAAGFGSPEGAPSMSDLAGEAAGSDSELNLDAAFGGGEPAAPAPSSRPAGEKEWYVAVDESQIGPIDLHDIEQRWDTLELDEDSLAWKAGMQDWLPIAEIAELAYLITERPQQKTATAALGAIPGASLGVGGPALGATAPVAFHGDSSGVPGGDVAWTPSAASALSSLVQDELTATPPAAETEAAPRAPAVESGMPSFGANTLFGSGGNGGAEAAATPPAPGGAMPPVAPAADPFAGGSVTQWSMPKPQREGGGIKPIHLALGGMGLLFVGLVVVVVLLYLRPQLQPSDPTAGAIAKLNETNGSPKPTEPSPPPGGKTEPDSPPVKPSKKASTSQPPRRSTTPAASVTPRNKEKRPPREKTKRKGNGGLDELLATPRPAGATAKKALQKADIMAGVKNGMGAVTPCIKAARAKGEITPGRHTLVLEWTIQPSGKVANPKLKGPSNVLGTSLPGCFARGMRRWTFPATEKGGPVRNFPFGPFTVK